MNIARISIWLKIVLIVILAAAIGQGAQPTTQTVYAKTVQACVRA